MKILHLDDQPSTVEWIPISLMAALGNLDNTYYSLVKKDLCFRFGEAKKAVNYQIAHEIPAFVGFSNAQPNIIILDFQIHGENMLSKPDLVLDSAIFWTAYPEEAKRAFEPNRVIAKGDRNSLLKILLDKIIAR
jgi:hypothetical protein